MLLLLLLLSGMAFAASPLSPLLPGSTLPPASVPSDNLFSPPPAAGLGTPMFTVNPASPTTSAPPTPANPVSGSTGPVSGRGPLSGNNNNNDPQTGPTTPGPSNPGSAGTNPSLPSNPVLNSTNPVLATPTVPGTAVPINTTTSGLQNLAPGTIHTDASTSANQSASAPDTGLGGLVTAGIVVASVVLASMVGIFAFRKWKLRPKGRDSRWRATTLDPFAAVPSSNLPLHQMMQQHHQQMARAHTPPQVGFVPMHTGTAGMYIQPAHATQGPTPPPVQATHSDMDLALRHHLRNG